MTSWKLGGFIRYSYIICFVLGGLVWSQNFGCWYTPSTCKLRFVKQDGFSCRAFLRKEPIFFVIPKVLTSETSTFNRRNKLRSLGGDDPIWRLRIFFKWRGKKNTQRCQRSKLLRPMENPGGFPPPGPWKKPSCFFFVEKNNTSNRSFDLRFVGYFLWSNRSYVYNKFFVSHHIANSKFFLFSLTECALLVRFCWRKLLVELRWAMLPCPRVARWIRSLYWYIKHSFHNNGCGWLQKRMIGLIGFNFVACEPFTTASWRNSETEIGNKMSHFSCCQDEEEDQAHPDFTGRFLDFFLLRKNDLSKPNNQKTDLAGSCQNLDLRVCCT